MDMRARALILIAAGATMAAGCANGGSAVPAMPRVPLGGSVVRISPIKHVVIVVQENRTFNDFFATFPGADGTTTGKIASNPGCNPAIRQGTIQLRMVPLVTPKDLNHSYQGFDIARHGGAMDGFDRVRFGNKAAFECTYPYQYTDPAQIAPYWDMAKQYALAEHMFTTQGSDSFTAHQDLIRGDTVVGPDKSMIDLPTCGYCHWGCDAPIGTYTRLITSDNYYLSKHGPFPCSKDFSDAYHTLRDLLDAKGLSWKYYVPAFKKPNGELLNAFDVIWPVRNGPEWEANVIAPQTKILTDIMKGSLPAVSWVIPDQPDSDHPGDSTDTGPSWVASIVNAIGKSSDWDSTAVVIVWDDWSGLYDNVPPKVMTYGGLGFRVPAIIVSPYAKPHYISPTNYEFGSILRYVEDNWHLGRLGTTDKRAKSISDCFDYAQTPIKFKPIPSKQSMAYFLHRAPSLLAPDDDM